MDHSLYLEQQKRAMLMPNGTKTPCGPAGAKEASFQTHIDRVEAVRKGISVTNQAATHGRGCCFRTVPQIFHYDDCWYIQRQAAEKNRA